MGQPQVREGVQSVVPYLRAAWPVDSLVMTSQIQALTATRRRLRASRPDPTMS